MNKGISEIYNSLQEIAWHFGNLGINGECCGDLSLVEFMALKKAEENKYFSIQEIGNALSFTKSGATRIIDRLVNKGYVVRVRSTVDGRVCCVSLTAKGKEILVKVLESYSLYLEEVLRDIEPPKVEIIKQALAVLLESVQRHELIKGCNE